MDARLALSHDLARLLQRLLGPGEDLREAVARRATAEKEETFVDYLLAGGCAAALFVYLLYALLKPERF